MEELTIEGENKKLLGYDVPDEFRISYHEGYFHLVVREGDDAGYVKISKEQARTLGEWLIKHSEG